MRAADREQFLLRRWQYELLTRLDGKRTFESASREVFRLNGGGFTALGLLNFYNWLYNEDIVVCECHSIFELVEEKENDLIANAKPIGEAATEFEVLAEAEYEEPISVFNRVWRNETARRLLQVSAVVILSLAVLRIGYVASPLVLSPAKKVYASWKQERQEVPAAESGNLLPDTAKSEIELAGKAMEVPEIPDAPVEEPTPEPDVLEIPDVPKVAEKSETKEEMAEVSVVSTPELLNKEMEELRRELAGCRIRRDEFYLQNDEAGYRREVKRMIDLAKHIGEIEAKL